MVGLRLTSICGVSINDDMFKKNAFLIFDTI